MPTRSRDSRARSRERESSLCERERERESFWSGGAAARVDGCDGATAGAVAGAASGGLAGALTTPLDVVRTRHVLFGQPGHSFLGTAHALWKVHTPGREASRD